MKVIRRTHDTPVNFKSKIFPISSIITLYSATKDSYNVNMQDGQIENFKWVKLTNTTGLISAEVIAGRLRTEGIPAFVWQQGAGEALGLYVGPMGFGHVMVPEHMQEDALEVISGFEELPVNQLDDQESEIEQEANPTSPVAKALLLILALLINLPAVIITLIVSLFSGRASTLTWECPYCQCQAELTSGEIELGRYLCPDCDHEVTLSRTF